MKGLRHLVISLLAFSFASCAEPADTTSTFLENPAGTANVELRDFGEGKQVVLHSSNSTEERRLVEFEICSDVSISWAGDDMVNIRFRDIEASYLNSYRHDDIDVTYCEGDDAACGKPSPPTIRVPGCY